MEKGQKLLSGWFIFSQLFESLVTPSHTVIYAYLLNSDSEDGLIVLKEEIGMSILSTNDRNLLESTIVFLSKNGFIRIQERPDEGENQYLLYLLDRKGGLELHMLGSLKPQRSIIHLPMYYHIHLEEIIKRRARDVINIKKMETSSALKYWFKLLKAKPNMPVTYSALLCWIDMQTFYINNANISTMEPGKEVLGNENYQTIIENLLILRFIIPNTKLKYSICLPPS